MLERCDTPLCPPTTNMKPSMTPTPKLILLSAMGATISQASLLGSYRSTLCGADTAGLTKKNTVVTKSKYKIGLISQRSTINRPQSECCIDFRREKSTTTYFTNSLLLLLLFNIHFCHIKKLFQVANTLIATSTNSVGRSPNLTTVKWTQNTSNLGLFCCMRGHTSHWGEKKIVPKDSLSKHILLKGFGSQGNKQQRRCSPEIHSNNRGLTSSTLPGTLSMKLQQPLLLWLLFTH